MEDAVESGSKERVLTPASQRVCGLMIVAGVSYQAVSQSAEGRLSLIRSKDLA